MTIRHNQDLLEYYKRELTYLRKMGTAFAETYPKVAGRLELGPERCPDPHIERLIESFAFLTGRIQYNIESEFPQLATALLGAIYPHFLAPVPSMTIARFDVDPTQGKLTSGHLVPRHTPLFAQTESDQHCRFRTCYPVTLWPLEVTYAGFEATDQYDFLDAMPQVAMALRIRVESPAGGLSKMDLSRLRFYLNADRMLAHSLYELLFCHVRNVAILPEGTGRPVFLSKDAVLPVGFGPDEDVLPYPANVHRGYRLIQEYFLFPEKYLFFDLDRLERHGSENFFDILILLDQIPAGQMSIDRETFSLGCTPVINLFPKTTDPIRLDERRPDYLLSPDHRRIATTEIHSILSVSTISDGSYEPAPVAPFFSYNHQMEKNDQRAFWHARREPTGRKELPGTHTHISLVDLDFNPARPPRTTLYAHTLCTNRRLAEEVPAGALLQIEQAAPLARIVTLDKPSQQLDPPMGGATLWRLISHLSLNYLSLSNDGESLKALREILRLYSFTDPEETYQQVSGIREMACAQVVRRIGTEAWRGFCRGIEITLVLDERLYVGSGAFLLAAVLDRFFPLYASVNSFTQLTLKSLQREGIWKRWQPVAGEQIVL
jgi:type VI secretion system protein ImpG